ncbi:TonB-dependent receptor [uncultured Alistipes sp.]|uniref:TonB-dependent receptor n=1 Tax=uncultured Alistipes sp. TaxID=538949 RepID=UPI00321F6855
MNNKLIQQIRCLITLLFMLCLSLSPGKAYSQDAATVTLSLENVEMRVAMNEIEKQTKFLFVSPENIDLSRLVSVKVENRPLREALEQMTAKTDIAWQIKAPSIFLSEKKPEAPVTVTGKVSDAAGMPVVGASVVVRGTNAGVSTGADGSFSLLVPPPAQQRQLEINFLGYEPVVVAVGGRTVFDITLSESASEIEQIVVTALGIKRSEKALSYNVQQVNSEDILAVKDANFINSLTGKVAGLTINTSSSGVGGASKVVLRGNKSISQSSNALYVIDGIPMYNFGGGGGTEFDSRGATESIADINPEDIESMSVLNGAAAAALYGSEAANGAIMITTKKGQSGALKVTLSSNTEFLAPFTLPEFQSRYGTGLSGSRYNSGVYSWGEKLAPAAQYGYTPKDFFETGHVYTNSVTVSGGTDRNQTYFSAASVNSDGIIPNNEYERYNFTFRNTSYFLKDKLRLDASASYIYQKDQNMTNQGVYSNPLVPAYLFPRGENFEIYKVFERFNPGTKLMEQFWSADMEGGDLRMQNPYWIAYRNLRNTDKKRYMLSFAASYDILPWLSVSGRVRLDNANSLYTQKLFATSNATITDGGKNGHYTEARTYDTQTYADAILNINKTFGEDWSLNANIGGSINNIKTDELSYRGPIQENGLPNIFNVFDLDDSKKRAEKSGWHDQTQSVFASVEVGWKQMLYLTVTGRNDWASQIAGSSSSSFFYPSVGLSWVPTSLWDLGDALTYLKVRGSIASVGLPFPRHLMTPTYEYDATNRVWKDKTHYPIGDLKPERTKTYEVGVDARLWKHVSLSASWYWADTYNQTFDPSLPPSSSYTTIYLQTGHVRNMGVELSLGYSNQWRDFGWSTNATFSWNKNEIIDLAADALNPVTGEPLGLEALDIKGLGKAKYILKQGGTLGDLYTTSNLRYNDNGFVEVDSGGNLILTDNGDEIYLGSVFPKYNLAWRNDFRWKGLNLSLLFSGRIGGICYSATQANMDLYGVSEASAAARDAGGVVVNGRQTISAQRWYQAIGSQSGLPQYYTYSATNFRLQELSLGYTLPRKWFRNKMGLTVSFVGRNLWMIYCKAPFDPEAVASTGMSYQGIDYFMMPSLRSLGFNVKFEF